MPSAEGPGDRTDRLNEHQQRHLVVSCQHIDKLLTDIETTAGLPLSTPLFPRYVRVLSPLQKKVLQDYLSGIRRRLAGVLERERLRLPDPHSQDVFAIRTTLTFVDIAIEELRPKYMRGYGDVAADLLPHIDGIVDELRTMVQKLNEYLAEDPGRDLRARLAKLDSGDDARTLKLLDRIITTHGLVEYRPRLAMLAERASSRTFEIAVVGRVSSGKSSLLNHVLGTDVLPVGVTPVTAVPTRIQHGDEPRLRVCFADRPGATLALDRVSEFATEEHNPGNRRHVERLVVDLPAPRLQEGIVFVDTPGLGSLARGGAEQTLAYLPHCDLGVVLVDAASTLTPDDLGIVQALQAAAIPCSVLLSKADLLAGADRERLVRYVGRQLEDELHLETRVYPVSVMPGHDEMLEHWFSREIAPLCGQRQEVARRSLQRKTERLKAAVEAALRVRLDAGSRDTPPPPDAVQEAEDRLSRAAGRLEPAVRECERLAEGIRVTGREIIERVASRLLQEHAATARDPGRMAETANAVLLDLVRERTERVRDEVVRLVQGATEALSAAASVLGLQGEKVDDSLEPLPQLAFTFTESVLGGRPCLAFNRALGAVLLRRHLRKRFGQRLDEALGAHAALMGAWARRAMTATRAVFEEHAEPLRTALAETRRPATGATGAGREVLERDLEDIRALDGGAAGADDSAGRGDDRERRTGT